MVVAVGVGFLAVGMYLCLAYFLDIPIHDELADLSLVVSPLSTNGRVATHSQPVGALVGPVLFLVGAGLIAAVKIKPVA